MKNIIRDFFIANEIIGPFRKVRALFSKNPYKNVKRNGSMSNPDFVVLENTSLCNLKCKMCYINFSKYVQKGLETEQWKKIVDKLPSSVKKISLIGGEPLLMKGATDLIKHIDSKGIIPIICTNATLINKENIKEIAKTKAIKHLQISIDGDRELHNTIRGVPTAFDDMIKGVKLVKEYGGEIETVTTVIQEDNFENLSQVVEVMHKLGLKHLLLEFERKYDSDTVAQSKKILGFSTEEIVAKESIDIGHKFSEQALKRALRKTEKLAKKYNIVIEYLPNNFKKDMAHYLSRTFRQKNKKLVCGYLPVARVDCQGNIITCFVLRQKMGNLLEKNFNEIWNSSEFRNYRKKLFTNNLVPICDTCFQGKKGDKYLF